MTREQERARARKQATKYEARQTQRDAEQARNRQVVGVVVAVLAVIAVFVGVSTQLGGDDEATPSAGGTSQSSQTSPSDVQTDPANPTETASAGPSAVAVPGCEAAPAAPPAPKTLSLPDKAATEGKTYTATVTTNCGDIVFELDGAKAPQTVASFNALSGEGYFDDSPCHRLTSGGLFVLQCGDPTGSGSGGPGYGFGIENAPADGQYPTGTLAMARTSDPNSNGSQFFIVYKDTQLPTDGGGYSIFGKVTQGLDIVQKVAAAGTDESNGAGDGKPLAPISILAVAVTEKKA